MATHFATIYRADDALARCTNCGAQQQFHGRPGRSCTDIVAETVDDIDPADLTLRDLLRHTGEQGDALDAMERIGRPSSAHDDDERRTRARVTECRAELHGRIKHMFGMSFDDLAGVLGCQVL